MGTWTSSQHPTSAGEPGLSGGATNGRSCRSGCARRQGVCCTLFCAVTSTCLPHPSLQGRHMASCCQQKTCTEKYV